MQSEKILKGAAVLLASAVFFLSGCSKTADKPASTAGTQGSSGPQAGAPVNHTSIIISDLQARLKEKPNDPELLTRLGDTYFETKQFSESAAYYKKAIEIKPGEADLYNDLGLSLHYVGNSAEGLRYIEEGLKKNPYHQRMWLTKGFIMAYGMGDLDGARAAWDKAKSISPESQVGKAASDFLAQSNKKQ